MVVEHSLTLAFFEIRMKADLFQSCGHCWVFQICWHIECNSLTASSFRIWNSSARVPSPPLALFIVMLSKAHLTSHSRMSGSRWITTSLCLSGPLTPFLYISCVYSCSDGEESACSVGTCIWSLGQEDPLEKGIGTYSGILSWRIPWTEEPAMLLSMGLQIIRNDWETNNFTYPLSW